LRTKVAERMERMERMERRERMERTEKKIERGERGRRGGQWKKMFFILFSFRLLRPVRFFRLFPCQVPIDISISHP
jgi:hypothetical protein